MEESVKFPLPQWLLLIFLKTTGNLNMSRMSNVCVCDMSGELVCCKTCDLGRNLVLRGRH